ncbi:putative ferric-chelate reductase 1 isoform X2 [Perca fluviatilis]|uniref:putative ferric-chelate reductase 1 isoform X2 n=1 Tax=Perca fluviatilis TaxID=8168 RepID=UPI00196611B6|nr:putative ferric-chelate reductase 1 isoform X2 [Perca fluviatilis]
MERGLILLVAALGVYVASGVQGTSYLSFSNNTQVNISQNGCGYTKLCVRTPGNCDPTGNTSCMFASVIASTPLAPNGSAMSFQLSGDSVGYIALGLTVNASQGTTMLFICAQNSSNNGSFFFQTVDQNNTNGALTPAERVTTEIWGIVNENVIKCEFTVPNMNSTTFSILLGTGNITDNGPSPFDISLNSGLLNLTNPASNVPTTAPPVTNTTVTNTTMANSIGAVQPHAVLLLLSVLTLSVMLRA